MNKTKTFLFALAAGLALFDALAAPATSRMSSRQKNSAGEMSVEFQPQKASKVTASTYKCARTTPVFTGEFKVDLVVITFPDCEEPESLSAVKEALFSLPGGFTIADYYKDYSQGITWPVLEVFPVAYRAPHPFGYYCRFDPNTNLIGYKGDGPQRAQKLREDALKYVRTKGRLSKKGAVVCYVYCQSLTSDEEVLERLLRPHYPAKPSQEALENGAVDKLKQYSPRVAWADPLWPNSIPQVTYPSNGGTLVHELGHVLGAPDFYHASEEHDGMPGSPCLSWAYGPTGMAYCRGFHNAFVPAAAYPKVTVPGDYTISPRSARFPMTGYEAIPPLGILVPSTHPHYLFYIEYCRDEKPPVGNPSASGLLIHVINVTLSSPMMGPPDLCYTYRSGDPDFKAKGGGSPYMQPGDVFDEKSDPAAVLPNFLPAGIAVRNIRFNEDGTCTFSLEMPKVKTTPQELNFALLPQVEMLSAGELLPTSFRASMNVKYRGEPLLTEYGFCYGPKKNPTERTGKLFRLYHRDRYDARIIDLKPGSTYYVRAYARSARGIRYSANEFAVTLPAADATVKGVNLFAESDRLLDCWYFKRWYFGIRGSIHVSANPLVSFMALLNYYRALPGSGQSVRRAGARPQASPTAIDMSRVHCNPTDGRPKFRMRELEALKSYVERLVSDAGLRKSDFIDENDETPKKRPVRATTRRSARAKADNFGKNSQWVAKCAAALKVSNPAEVFFSCKTEEELLSCADKIRASIMQSRPVLVVRENRPRTDEESNRWPLDIAIIDGIGESENEFHVIYPLGRDRSYEKSKECCVELPQLLHRTTDAMLMFYRP